ncbi:hypothetical protein [Corallincola luteus]|nr:hypothetical protein [Corallincola luteus]
MNASAEPTIGDSDVTPTVKADLAQGVTVTVKGSGFGAKEMAAPRFYDRGDVAYERGVANDHQSNFADGAEILRTEDDPETIWTKSSNYSFGIPPVLTRSRDRRTPYLNSHYYMHGVKAYLGWPAAISEGNTEKGQKKTYISWWMKVLAHPQHYYQHTLSNRTGDFIVGSTDELGEEVRLSNGKSARLIHIETAEDGLEFAHIDIDEAKKLSDLGSTVVGVTSGAQAVLADQHKSYGSNKFIRVWDNPGGENLRYSWTNDELGGMSSRSYTDWIGTAGKWVHMEMYLDIDAQRTLAWVDNVVNHDMPMAEMKQDPNYSPNIGLLGFDGKVQTLQQTDVSEIYFDYTPQRVVLGNAPEWVNVTHAELQMPQAWTNDEVKFKLDLGSFEELTGSLFVYIFDENNVPNAKGYQLCRDCKAKPSPVQFN